MRTPRILLSLTFATAIACGDKDATDDTAEDTGATAGADEDGDEETDTDGDADGPVDADADGFPSDQDCDDDDPSVHPDAAELCDGIDNDCDGTIDEDDAADAATWYADADADGWGDAATPTAACAQPSGFVADDTDCDDDDDAIHPDAAELCDGIDNDCDGTIDEDDAADAATWYADADGDGHGDASTAVVGCAQPFDHVADGTDCDDAASDTHPGATEMCDAVDNDCDGTTDEDDAADAATWYADADADGFGDATTPTAACAQPSGFVADDTDCDDAAGAVNPGALELCDTVDNDCDGTTDEDDAADAATWYADLDEDGWGDEAAATTACAEPSGHGPDGGDCDDDDDSINPDATELCDTVDNDCDGTTDEDDAADAATWYADADADGYGDASTTTLACSAPSSHTSDATDCDDTDPLVHPSAAEVCDAVDNDCDGTIDEDDATDAATWYADLDEDGWGDDGDTTVQCAQPSGYEADGGDCDDADPWTFPGATELCDGHQNDCDTVGWTDDAGLASVEDSSGDWTDVTATLAAGATGAVVSHSLNDETLHVCDGTWFVSVDLSGTGGITGQGDNVFLSGDDSERVFSASGDDVTLENLTLQDGYSSGAGGAVYLSGVDGAVLSDVNIINSEADKGGGIHAYNLESLDLTNVTIDDNTATNGYGGGLNIWDVTDFSFSTLVISNNTNTSSYGGGGLATYGSVTTTGLDLVLESNTAAGFGGGWSIIGGTHEVLGVEVTGNLSDGAGGGIDTTGSLALEDGEISDNEGNYGGALRVKGSTTLFEATDLLFEGNTASNTGAGVHFASSASGIIDSCAFTDNTSPSGKPTLNNSGDTIEIIDSDFSGSDDYDAKSGGTSYLWDTAGVDVVCDSTGCI